MIVPQDGARTDIRNEKFYDSAFKIFEVFENVSENCSYRVAKNPP